MPHAEKHGKVTMHPIAKSSHLEALGYDPDRQELHVKFLNGHSGHYNNVDHNTFVVILAAPSKGTALHRLVKKFPQKHPWVPHEKKT